MLKPYQFFLLPLPGNQENVLENQAKVEKSLVSKKIVLQNRFPPPSSKMQNFQTSLSQYPNFQTEDIAENMRQIQKKIKKVVMMKLTS